MTVSNLVYKQKNESSLISWMKRRVDRNDNCNSTIFGPTGIGKSYACIKLACDLDPDFNPEKQVVFSLLPIIKLMKDEEFMKKKYKVIIYEEFQITGNARTWQSKMNRLLNMILSTYRFRNIILLVNCPFEDYIDSQAKKLFHISIEVKQKDHKNKRVMTRAKVLQYNSKQKQFYEHSLYVKHPNGQVIKQPTYWIRKAPDDILERYEKLKSEFFEKLTDDVEKELNEFEQSKQKDDDGIETRKRLTERQEEIMRLLANTTAPNKTEVVAQSLGVSLSVISRAKGSARKKGYHLEEFEENDNE